MAMSDDEREVMLGRFAAANLPITVRNLSRSMFPTKRVGNLMAYLASGAYAEDLSNGIGVYIYGSADIRSQVFSLIAKPFAMSGKGVFFCSLHHLISILKSDKEKRATLARTQHLFVDMFEKEFVDGVCPYTVWERSLVEEFLQQRITNKFVSHYSAGKKLDQLKWWSRDFLQVAEATVTQISIGA
jgi:hypothetical protein